MPGISIIMDPFDVEALTKWLDNMGRRTSRAEILPIMMKHLEPVVAAERKNLAGHVKSGALMGSLQARSESAAKDRPGTISVFSAATLPRSALIKAWKGGRKQQQGWAERMKKRGRRRRVFYDVMIEAGHRKVKKIGGVLKEIGSPVPGIFFAKRAMADVGEREADAAAIAVMDHILG